MKAINKLLISIFLPALFLSGCGIYKEYERPDISFTDSLYTKMTTDTLCSDSCRCIQNLSWKELFRDTLLHRLIETGLANNTDLKTALLRSEEAAFRLESANLSYVPSVSFGISADSQGKSITVGPEAQWEIDIFGRLTNARRSAKAAVEQSHAYRQAVETQLIATIATTYYTLLMLDEQIRISHRTIGTWEESIRTLSALKRAGKTNEAAVLQSKANKLNVEGSVLTLKMQIIEQENNLCALLGIPPQRIVRGELSEQTFPQELSAGIPSELLCRRPDIKEAEAVLRQAFYATNTARANFYPQITLGGMAGWTNGSGATFDDPAGMILKILGSLIQPVFNRGQNIANLKISKAQQEEALLAFRQSILDAGTEVNIALARWQTARERIGIDKKQIMCLQATVWNTSLLMKHGNASYLEVLTAQQTLLQAELTAVADRYDEIQSVIELYRALGGGYRENSSTHSRR